MQSTKKVLVRKEEGSAVASEEAAALAPPAGLNAAQQVSRYSRKMIYFKCLVFVSDLTLSHSLTLLPLSNTNCSKLLYHS